MAVERDGKERKDGGGTAKWMRWWDDSVWRCGRRVISRKEGVGVDGDGVATVRKIVPW